MALCRRHCDIRMWKGEGERKEKKRKATRAVSDGSAGGVKTASQSSPQNPHDPYNPHKPSCLQLPEELRLVAALALVFMEGDEGKLGD